MTTLTRAESPAHQAAQGYDVDTAECATRSVTQNIPAQHKTERPSRSRRVGTTGSPARRSGAAKRMGSRQVISVRGRRVVSEEHRVKRTTIQFIIVCILMIGIGVGVTMYLSGVTTQQSFSIQKAKDKKTTLDNELEALHRDVKNASSNSEVARKATHSGMVVPDQPGIMTVNPDGSTVENRAATPSKTHDVLDINSGSAPKAQASSDPKKTKRIPGTAAPIDVLRHDTGRPVQLAPYQDTDSHRPGPNGNSPAGRPEGIGPRTDHPSVPGHSAENPVPVPAPNAPMAAP